MKASRSYKGDESERNYRNTLPAKHQLEIQSPTASHMGGVWERQIRTACRILDTLLWLDVKDPHPLSPNQILTMKTGTALPPPGRFQRNDVYMRQR